MGSSWTAHGRPMDGPWNVHETHLNKNSDSEVRSTPVEQFRYTDMMSVELAGPDGAR